MNGGDLLVQPSLVQPSAQAVIADADSKAAGFKTLAGALHIVDERTRGQAVELRATVKDFLSKADELRTGFVKPLNDHVRRINDAFKKSMAPAMEALAVLDQEILRDRREQERLAAEQRRLQQLEQDQARRAAEEEQAARAREIAAAAETVAKDAGMSESEAKEMGQLYAQDELAKPPVEKPVQVLVVPDPPKTTKTAAGSSVTVRKVPAFEVVDMKVLPDRFLVVDKAKLGEEMRLVLRATGRFPEIPGVRFFYDDQVAGGRR